MEIKFNTEKLNILLDKLADISRASFSFINTDFHQIAYSKKETEFCCVIRETTEGLANCKISDASHFYKAKSLGRTLYYTCHAGITETVTPFYYDEILIGYLVIGRFRDKEGVYSTEKGATDTLSSYGLSSEKAKSLYHNLPVLSSSDIESIMTLFDLGLKGIWYESGVRIDNDVLTLEIENYLKSNLRGKITLDSLCKKFYLSKHALYQRFQDGFNCSPCAYLTSLRINKAKELLLNTNKPLRDIADESGFCDYNYFTRVFKKSTKCSPLRYRIKMRK